MHRKFRTISISLLLIFVFVMSNIMTAFATTIKEIEDYTSGQGLLTGKAKSDMRAEQIDEYTIVMIVTSRTNGKEYVGHEADGIFGNSYGDKQQILDTLRQAGVVDPEKALNEKGMYFNSRGALRDQNGQVRTIDLRDILPPPPPPPPPSSEFEEESSNSSSDPTPPSDDPTPPSNDPTPPSEDPTPPPHIHNYRKYVVGYAWRLDSLKVKGENKYYDKVERVGVVEKVLGTNSPVSKQINKKLYERNSSLSRAYNDSKISINIDEVHPDWVGASLTYTATWIEIEKYYEECSCGSSYGPYYRQAGSKTQNIKLDYSAVINKPVYYSYLPIDLATLNGYKGNLQIPNKHGHESNIKQEDGRSGETIPIKVTKSGFGAREGRLQLSSTNKPGIFTIDFRDTWFGLSEESQNIIGKIAWAELWYGADHLQDTRDPKINTITKFGNPNEETWSSEKVHIDDPKDLKKSYTFYLRSIKPNRDPNTPYYLGEGGNNCWVVYFELNRSNRKGIDWNVYCDDSPNSLKISLLQDNYVDYIIYNTYVQPILYGEYEVLTVGGR